MKKPVFAMFRNVSPRIAVLIIAIAVFFTPQHLHAQTPTPTPIVTVLETFGGAFGKYGTTPTCIAYFGDTSMYELDCPDAESSGSGLLTFSSDGTIHPYFYPQSCLDFAGGIYPCNGENTQVWYYLDGVIQPRSRNNSGCLNAAIPPAQGVVITVQPCNEQPQQIFVPLDINMMLENDATSTCLAFNTSSDFTMGSAICNAVDPNQQFVFTSGANEADSENGFYAVLQANTSTGDQCVSYDGNFGDYAYLDANCNTSQTDPAWEFWKYTDDQRLMNAENVYGATTCLSTGTAVFPGHNVIENECTIVAEPPQIWTMWINGFPDTRFPLIPIPRLPIINLPPQGLPTPI